MKKIELTETQKRNALLIANALRGLYDVPEAIIAAICVAAKESGLRSDRREGSHEKTTTARLRKLFGERLEKYDDASVRWLKKHDEEFFNAVYNGRLGNRPGTNNGYDFRGFGYNQITGRANFAPLHMSMAEIMTPDGGAEAYARHLRRVHKPHAVAKAPSPFRTERKFWLNFMCRLNAGWGYGYEHAVVIRAVTNAAKYWDAVAEVVG